MAGRCTSIGWRVSPDRPILAQGVLPGSYPARARFPHGSPSAQEHCAPRVGQSLARVEGTAVSQSSSLAVRDCGESRYFERGCALNRLLLEAPYLARCSDDKTAAKVRPREYAIRHPYMQVNRPGMVSWLIFDLDHPNAAIWEDAGLPCPNLIVRNRDTGHSHLFYAIAPVCTTDKARSKPIAYMRAIYEAMALRLDADPRFHSGPVAKTPGHPWWDTTELHPVQFELGKLADYVDLAPPSPFAKGPQLEQVSHSRHCALFELLRHYAYSIVNREREEGSYERFVRLLEAFCLNHSQRVLKITGKAEELAWSSIKATAKSVARWTWDRYKGAGGVHRGVMQLDGALPLPERQRLAAQRTHELRNRGTESRVRAACRQLVDQGANLALATVARVAGLTRQTIAKYRYVLAEVASAAAPVVQSLRQAVQHALQTGVKHAVHQVAAAPAQPLGPGEVLPNDEACSGDGGLREVPG
jgi:hypothetical protein